MLDHDLLDFYRLDTEAGKSQRKQDHQDYSWLSIEGLADRYVQYRDASSCRITLQLPSIHCISCVWLLEHFHQLLPGIISGQVNFARREATFLFDPRQTDLPEIARLLNKIGYPPEFKEAKGKAGKSVRHGLIYRIGYAGFAFGNIMLLSLPEYFGLAADSSSAFFGPFVGYLMLLLTIPMLRYGGDQYLINAWVGLKRGHISLDVPIAIGIAVLFLRSAFEIISGSGAGYLDSLAGLIFFLLLGRWFQSLTYERLSFDRDHKDYFPVAAYRKLPSGEIEPISVEALVPGERIIVRPGQLIPADGKLLNTTRAPIDYSFVTGEAQAQYRTSGERVYAGGRAVDHTLEVELTSIAAESYLLQLWRDKATSPSSEAVTVQTSEQLSKYFTLTVLGIALLTFLFWLGRDPTTAFQAATAVLIIACPCALALTAPFAYGSMMRFFGKAGFFLRSATVLDELQQVDTFVFDKTGTLVEEGSQDECHTSQDADQAALGIILAMSLQSDHPRSQSMAKRLRAQGVRPAPIGSVTEQTGRGLWYQEGSEEYRIGSADFCAIEAGYPATYARTTKKILLETQHNRVDLRDEIAQALTDIPLRQRHLLSGDHPTTLGFWEKYFAADQLHFLQSPFDKQAYLENLQDQGKRSLMLGDGLNDSGALKTASVGLAVTEDLARFSPACDGIVLSRNLGKLTKVLAAARRLPLVLRSAYVLAILYNIVGLSYAVSGQLSPVIAAILMPLSSITVVSFTVLATWWQCRKIS